MMRGTPDQDIKKPNELNACARFKASDHRAFLQVNGRIVEPGIAFRQAELPQVVN